MKNVLMGLVMGLTMLVGSNPVAVQQEVQPCVCQCECVIQQCGGVTNRGTTINEGKSETIIKETVVIDDSGDIVISNNKINYHPHINNVGNDKVNVHINNNGNKKNK